MTRRPRPERSFDIVLWGATGYTGRLVADELAREPSLRWAIAGRDRGKLERVRAELGQPSLPILLGDAADQASLDHIVKQTGVVCTTVGPYAKYGSGLVAACVRAGTDYCDLTGEVQWVRRMIDAHHEGARATGARIVHCCGFDSVPSDLGTWMLQTYALAQHGKPCTKVRAYVGESRGGVSGGTAASMIHLLEEAERDPSILRIVEDPYSLDPTPRQGGVDGPDQRGVRYAAELGRYTAPFVMAAINARVVRRSNALAGYAWGRDFSYEESMSVPPGVRGLAMAAGVAAGMSGGMLAMRVPALRRAIAGRLPAPGQGPSPEVRARGHYVIRFYGEVAREGGAVDKVYARVGDRRDPGYGSTSVMLSRAALTLAAGDGPDEGGVLTPSVALGAAYLDRLRVAGMTWQTSSSRDIWGDGLA